jgi:hypothetical protein
MWQQGQVFKLKRKARAGEAEPNLRTPHRRAAIQTATHAARHERRELVIEAAA